MASGTLVGAVAKINLEGRLNTATAATGEAVELSDEPAALGKIGPVDTENVDDLAAVTVTVDLTSLDADDTWTVSLYRGDDTALVDPSLVDFGTTDATGGGPDEGTVSFTYNDRPGVSAGLYYWIAATAHNNA